jgi:predicted nucleotidyltransferase component of viral defense system
MIDERYIKEWASTHPWRRAEQVEQDLLLSRVLVAIYSDAFLSGRLAFRGGTALHKLYFSPQVRYSEDIDLVQVAGFVSAEEGKRPVRSVLCANHR